MIEQAVAELADSLSDDERARFDTIVTALRVGEDLPPWLIATAYRALGGRAAERDRSDVTVRMYRASIEIDPSDASYHYDLGNHLIRTGQTEEAIAAYGWALALAPDLVQAHYNRGRALIDSGRVDEAMEDFAVVARCDFDLPGYHAAVARRIIPERGFDAFVRWVLGLAAPEEQVQGFLRAYAELVESADPWFEPASVWDREFESPLSVIIRGRLADILRESPAAHMVGRLRMTHTQSNYDARISASDEFKVWYRPAGWGVGGPPPDRVDHLSRLAILIDAAREASAPEAAWVANYMAGAIVLSGMLGGRRDWPHNAALLTVPWVEGQSATPDPDRVAQVEHWVRAQSPRYAAAQRPLARFALDRFAAATAALVDLRLRRRKKPGTHVLLGDDGMPVERDGHPVVESAARDVAYRTWAAAEEPFREWILTASLVGDPNERLAAGARARAYSAIAATELWDPVPSRRWRDHRDRIATAYAPEPKVEEVQAALGPDAALLDFYVHEIVEDTILPTVITATQAELQEHPVDTQAGDLRQLLAAHRPGEMPPEGISQRVDELLLRPVASHLRSIGTLVVVPFNYLRNVPFHALPTVRDAVDAGSLEAIAYLPTVGLLADLRVPVQRRRTRRCAFVGFDSSGSIDINAELAIVRESVGDVTVLRDSDATLERVLAALQQYDIVHIACHGDMDRDIAAGYLELADSRLYPWDVLDARGAPETVILNACLTTSTERFAQTSDGGFGLHTALLTIGARHVIGGLWEINEWSALHFARSFYPAWVVDGVPPAAAVIGAQTAMRAQTDDAFLWAPHALFGDWH